MREGDDLFFAPEIRFAEVDLASPRLAEQVKDRIAGFYLQPAEQLVREGHAFAAGLIIVATIDFLAGLEYPWDPERRDVKDDFESFVRSELPSFRPGDVTRFYEDFRNGLIHEARIKHGGEFNLHMVEAVSVGPSGQLCVNPSHLLHEVKAAVSRLTADLGRVRAKRERLARKLAALFRKEFETVARGRAAV